MRKMLKLISSLIMLLLSVQAQAALAPHVLPALGPPIDAFDAEPFTLSPDLAAEFSILNSGTNLDDRAEAALFEEHLAIQSHLQDLAEAGSVAVISHEEGEVVSGRAEGSRRTIRIRPVMERKVRWRAKHYRFDDGGVEEREDDPSEDWVLQRSEGDEEVQRWR